MIYKDNKTIENIIRDGKNILEVYNGDKLVWPTTQLEGVVDLGLPSGLLWATCNLGAETETETGLYFAWGETEGYATLKPGDGFTWSTYKLCEGTQNTLTKYCRSASFGAVDNKTILDLEDDAAVVTTGGNYRMPSKEEFQELIDYTVSGNSDSLGWVTNYKGSGVNGTLRKSKVNENTIFFPAVGSASITSITDKNSYAIYWCTSLGSRMPTDAVDFAFGKDYLGEGGALRCYGHTLRAVSSIK